MCGVRRARAEASLLRSLLVSLRQWHTSVAWHSIARHLPQRSWHGTAQHGALCATLEARRAHSSIRRIVCARAAQQLRHTAGVSIAIAVACVLQLRVPRQRVSSQLRRVVISSSTASGVARASERASERAGKRFELGTSLPACHLSMH